MADKTRMSGFRSLPEGEQKCIWMEAGVIDYKLCNEQYNCHACAFDRAMKQAAARNVEARLQGLELRGKKAHIVPWQEKMRQRPGLQRECRHTATGRAPFRLCPYEFDCSSCQFDQMLEDAWELQIPFRLANIPRVEGYGLPDGHFFHLGHTWARVEHGGRLRIGVDDFSMRVFGPVDKLDLPLTGEQIKLNQVGLEFNRSGKEAAMLSPITGVVAAVNYQATRETLMVKQQPYNDGWLMVIDPVDVKKDLKELLYGKESTEWIRNEHQKLAEMVSAVGMTFADGGPIEDVVGRVPDLEWDRLTQEFLRT